MLSVTANGWTPLSSNPDDESCESNVFLISKRSQMVAVVAVVGLLTFGSYRFGDTFGKDRVGKTLSLATTQPAADPPPYLKGWPRMRWMTCAASFESCPMKVLDNPSSGCATSELYGNFLLTGDGLSSPPVRQAFKAMLDLTASKDGMSDRPVDRRIVVVLDAAFDAFEKKVQFLSAGGYCQLRQRELSSLGATDVICVILDPFVRLRLAKLPSETRENKAFAEAISKITDDMILDELDRAFAIFVEAGDPVILLRNFKRALKLNKDRTNSLSSAGMSLRGIIRAKVHTKALFYVGVSSGASIAGDFMLEMSPDEGDNSGLGLVPNCSFYPHADHTSDAKMMRQLAAAYHTEVMAIPDCQPIVNTKSRTGHLEHLCPHQLAMPSESQGL